MGNVVVHLVRHEKTGANAKRQYLGWTDESILAGLANFNMPISPLTVYGSDLKRCRETASAYFPEANYIASQDLRECNFGDFEMKTYEELKDIPIYRQWVDKPEEISPPNGEHYADFSKRVLNGFRQMVTSEGEYTFVIHGGAIRILLSRLGPVAREFNEIIVPHRTLHTLYWRDIKQIEEGERCESLLVVPIMEKDDSSEMN